MIDNNNIHPQPPGQVDFRMGSRATISRYQDRHPIRGQLSYRSFVETIPFFVPVWDIHHNVGPKLAKKLQEEAHGRDPIHVIITIATHPFPFENGPMNAIDHPFHIRKKKRIMPTQV